MRTVNDKVEQIAIVLYSNEGGMTDQDYKECTGIERKGWRPPEGVSWPTMYEEFLCEHERREYIWQAEKVLEFMGTLQ